MDDKAGKLKAELALMQSNLKIYEEKQNNLENRVISMPDQREVASPMKEQHTDLSEIEKKIHALKKGYKALKDDSDA